MKLNLLLEKKIEEKKQKSKEVDTKYIHIFLSLGIRISLTYVFYIFIVGKYLANFLGYDNLFLTALLLGTITNIWSIYKIFKDLKIT